MKSPSKRSKLPVWDSSSSPVHKSDSNRSLVFLFHGTEKLVPCMTSFIFHLQSSEVIHLAKLFSSFESQLLILTSSIIHCVDSKSLPDVLLFIQYLNNTTKIINTFVGLSMKAFQNFFFQKKFLQKNYSMKSNL